MRFNWQRRTSRVMHTSYKKVLLARSLNFLWKIEIRKIPPLQNVFSVNVHMKYSSGGKIRSSMHRTHKNVVAPPELLFAFFLLLADNNNSAAFHGKRSFGARADKLVTSSLPAFVRCWGESGTERLNGTFWACFSHPYTLRALPSPLTAYRNIKARHRKLIQQSLRSS